ncbi:hypothetical protein [Rubripirellula reticaptiva]|uniref:General secretion pathway protein K n=1 Tax=Rubripirellula reticaptiva TaxID=2528013 RepID=A0A5C6FCR4_9BACT|nr:hypothetical protein [Rubripirellula reticaptiva]TWU58094.1 hypothetical protein Poly59_10030 [Rubripirellula reticaptiva]
MTRKGYVLLVVIAVSVLVITVLATLAKVSLRRGLEAADAERDLRSRWGALTIERVVKQAIPKVFDDQEKIYAEKSPEIPPPATIRAAVTLSGITFDLLLGDEDAKLNLNAMYHHAGPMKTQQAIERVIGRAVPGTIRLIPAVEPLQLARENKRLKEPSSEDGETAEPELPAAFRSWGEVFDIGELERQARSPVALPNVTTGISLWGNGVLNIRRASDEAILAVVGSVVQDGGAQKFLKRFRENPTVTLGVILQTEVSGQDNRDQITALISETSTNYSVWIDASSRSGTRLRTFAATVRDETGITQHTRFAY